MNEGRENFPYRNRTEEPLRGPFGGGAIALGRVLGIRIGLDYSWIVIFLLVTFSLSQEFSEEYKNWPSVAAYSAGIVTGILFFVSILLHELGHSLTSNALGLPIRSITLFIFGGVARLSREPDRPRDEFLIAIAGPAVSLALGVAFTLLARAIPPPDPFALVIVPSELVKAIAQWLGRINFTLILFNCVPGFPLDGGRVFRSAIWAWSGSYAKATRIAARGGAIFAYLLILGGIFSIFAGAPAVNGLWMAFIGWFLRNAARSSVAQMMLKEGLTHILVGETFIEDCFRVPGNMSVAQLIEGPILRQGHRAFSIEVGDQLAGLVTLNEVKQVPEEQRVNVPVQAIAEPIARFPPLSPSDSLWTALQRMDQAGVHQLPVVEGDALLGVLTRETLFRIVRNQMEFGI